MAVKGRKKGIDKKAVTLFFEVETYKNFQEWCAERGFTISGRLLWLMKQDLKEVKNE